MTSDLILRDFRPDDLEAVLALKKTLFPHLDIDTERRRWRWEFDENPARPPHLPPVWIFEKEGRVVGSYGLIPLAMSLCERDLFGICGTDFCMDPSMQGKGIGQAFIRRFLDPSLCEFPFFVVPTEVTLHLMMKYGAIVIDGNSERCLWVFYCNSPEDPPAPDPAIRIEELNDFDARFDSLFSRVRRRYGLMVTRDQRYLRWRYLRFPFCRPRIFAADRDDGELCGFAVLLPDVRENRSYVTELLHDPDDSSGARALLSRCSAAARESGVAELYIIHRALPVHKDLEASRFHPVPKHLIRFGCRLSLEGVSPDDWYLTTGDGDLLYSVVHPALQT